MGPVTYLIQKNHRTAPITVHVDKMKACSADPVVTRDDSDANNEHKNTQGSTAQDQDNTEHGERTRWPRRRQIPARYRD